MKTEDYIEILRNGRGENIAIKHRCQSSVEATHICSRLHTERERLLNEDSSYENVLFEAVGNELWLFNRNRLDDGISKPEAYQDISPKELKDLIKKY